MPDAAAIADPPKPAAEANAVATGTPPASPPVQDGDGAAKGSVTPAGPVRDLQSELADATPEEAKAIIASLPKEARDAVLAEYKAEQDDRERTRTTEMQTAIVSRTEAYDTLEKAGNDAEDKLAKRLTGIAKAIKDFEYEDAEALADPGAIAELIEDYKIGAIAAVGKLTDAAISRFEAKYADDLKDATPEQARALEQARYNHARKGHLFDLLETIYEIGAASRERRAGDEGEQRGRTAVKPELIRQIGKVRGRTTSVAPRVIGGRPGTRGEDATALRQEMEAIDVTTPEGLKLWREKEEEFRRRKRR